MTASAPTTDARWALDKRGPVKRVDGVGQPTLIGRQGRLAGKKLFRATKGVNDGKEDE